MCDHRCSYLLHYEERGLSNQNFKPEHLYSNRVFQGAQRIFFSLKRFTDKEYDKVLGGKQAN